MSRLQKLRWLESPELSEAAQSLSLEKSRVAQRTWAAEPLRSRLRFVRSLRGQIASNAELLLDCFPTQLSRTRSDSLTAEVIPLAEACRFLELNADRILAGRKLSKRGRPVWLNKLDVEVQREPFGIVLLIGPANYPLLLTGVQALQALVAGNAVVIKPGRGAGRLAQAFADLVIQAGLPSDLLTVLNEGISSVQDALDAGVDKIVLTGSVQSGKAVLRQAAERIIPVTAELSGSDPVFVQAGADLKRAAAAVHFGTDLNGGDTCIAPKRVYVHSSVADQFRADLGPCDTPVVAVRDDDEALELAARSPYALGASVFGGEAAARKLASRINAGLVVINDMIVPTADPRVPFGGRAWSGFGTTRGAEGLLEMTTPKAVLVQRSGRLRHLEPLPENSEEFFLAFLKASHTTSIAGRIAAWRRFLRALSGTRKVKQ